MRNILLLIMLWAISTAWCVADNTPLFELDVNSDLVQKQLNTTRTFHEENGVWELTVSQSQKSGSNKMEIPVDIASVVGKSILLEADVFQTDISSKPNSWNGVKVMLAMIRADGQKSFPQAQNYDGNRNWTRHKVNLKIPVDAKSLSIILGLENVKGTVRFRNVRIREIEEIDYSKTTIKGWTNDNQLIYQPGESMKIYFQIFKLEKAISGKLRVICSSDDQRKTVNDYDVSSEMPLEITSSLNTPGFVMVRAQLLTPEGLVAVRKTPTGSERILQYGLGAGVEIDKLVQGIAEPNDFDYFWEQSRKELTNLPLEVLEKKRVKSTDLCDVYVIKIASPGPRPAVGCLTIPKNAKVNSMPLEIRFDGYGVRSINPVETDQSIVFFINAHGIDNGLAPEYYKDLEKGKLNHYGFNNDENKAPDTCYFKYMILRDLRGVEYAKTLPEWDRKHLVIKAGSQGAFQSIAVAALTPEITECSISIPWFCDLGGITIGRTRGWRPDWKSGLGYYDTVNFARRVKCPTEIEAGLSDWVCPPSGVCVLYNNLKVVKKLTLRQGWDHAAYFGYDQKSTPTMTIEHK